MPTRPASWRTTGRTAVVATLLRWCARSGNSSTRTRISDGSRQPPASIPAHLWQGAIPESAPLADQGGAFSTLPNALEGTQMGRRDKLVIRLGLAGVRAQEIVGLQIGDLRDLDTDHPSLHWTGKRYKPLHIAHGPHTVVALRRYLADHREQLGGDPPPDARLICRRRPVRTARASFIASTPERGLPLGPAVGQVSGTWSLGPLARLALATSPRMTYGVVHGDAPRSKGPDGSHRFDFWTSRRSSTRRRGDHHEVLPRPMDTEVMDRAVRVLD